MTASASGSTVYTRRVPTARSETSPTDLRICRCCDTAERVMGMSRARSLTAAGASTRRSTMARRVGSAIASINTEALVTTNASYD